MFALRLAIKKLSETTDQGKYTPLPNEYEYQRESVAESGWKKCEIK